MSLLNGFQGQVDSVQSAIKNPFSSSVDVPFDGNDFPDGFAIEEILEDGQLGEHIRLFGNMLPKIPFTFGGSQRIKKDYYPGYSEPVMQVMGSEEDDLTINGEFKDKGYNRDLKGVSSDIQQLVDGIRLRGNLVRIALGEFERYAIISKTKFDMDKLSRIQYSITFSIIGFSGPTNARFINQTREVPVSINRELIQQAQDFQEFNDNIPDTVPRSIGETIGSLTSTIAGAVNTVTGFVDNILSTVQDVQKSVTRAKGIIRFAQSRVNDYKRLVGALKPFDEANPLASKYSNAKFYASGLAMASVLTALLERLRAQISNITPTVPQAKHLVVFGDNLQKISLKSYGTADHWKKIYDYNKLKATNLVPGTVLELPKL